MKKDMFRNWAFNWAGEKVKQNKRSPSIWKRLAYGDLVKLEKGSATG